MKGLLLLFGFSASSGSIWDEQSAQAGILCCDLVVLGHQDRHLNVRWMLTSILSSARTMDLRLVPVPSGKACTLWSQDDGLIKGFEQASLVSPPRARNIESSSVVHRGADYRQAYGDVNT